MSNEIKKVEIDETQLGAVAGGASDYSSVCEGELSSNCYFCIRSVHGQYTFSDGVTKDTIGCGLSPGQLGNVNGYVLVNKVPVPM